MVVLILIETKQYRLLLINQKITQMYKQATKQGVSSPFNMLNSHLCSSLGSISNNPNTINQSKLQIINPTNILSINNQQNSSNKHNQQYIKRIMEYMREQIQISCRFYTDKFKSQINAQAKEIVSLRELLFNNNALLVQKNQIIEKLSKEGSTKKKYISLSKGIDEKVYGKYYNQIQLKVKQIQDKFKIVSQEKQQLIGGTQTLNQKITYLEKDIIRNLGYKVNSCTSKLQQHLHKEKSKIIMLEERILCLHNSIDEFNKQVQITQTNNQYKDTKKDVQEIKNRINSILNKQFKYENYKVEELRKYLHTINLKINELDQYKYQKSNRLPNPLNYSTSYAVYKSQKIIRQENVKKSSLKKIDSLTTTELTTNTSKQKVTSGIQKQQEQLQYENYQDIQSLSQNNSNNDDEFFYPNQQTQNTNIEKRLTNVILAMKLGMPVLSQIDQTGYLKSIQTGMYLVDFDGDGFQLDDGELLRLVKKGILKIK